VRDDRADAGALHLGHDAAGLGQRRREGLLEEQMLAGAARGLRDGGVEHRRHDRDDGLDPWVLDEGAPVGVEGAAERGGEGLALGPVTARDRDQPRTGHVLREVADVPETVLAGADDADPEGVHGRRRTIVAHRTLEAQAAPDGDRAFLAVARRHA
jgi:hypothetical protein